MVFLLKTSTTRVGTDSFATVRIQLGSDTSSTFLGDATIEVSGISLEKTETSDESETLTQSALDLLQTSNDGKMHYYTGNSKNIDVAEHYYADDSYVFEWSDVTYSSYEWDFQMFWMLTEEQIADCNLTGVENYTLTFKLNSSVAHSVLILGQEYELVVGDNEISVIGNSSKWPATAEAGGYCSFHIQAGTASSGLITSGKFVITDINFEEYVMPSTHDNSYVVDFSSVQLATQQDELYDSTAYNYLTRWSNLTDWGGPYNVSVTDESLDTNGYTAKFTTIASSFWYDFQLFYQGPQTGGLATGVQYYVEMKINVDKDAYVTINDVPTQLSAGENDVTVISGHKKGETATTWDYQTYSKTDLEFQAGVDGVGIAATELTLTISYLAFYWDD